MKHSRYFMFPLFAAALAFSPLGEGSAIAQKNLSTSSGFSFVNGLNGSNRVDVYMDGKAIWRNAREGRPMKQKRLNSEGYIGSVNTAKSGFSYMAGALALTAGRNYTAVPTYDSWGNPSILFIDLPHLVVPKYASHIVFGVAVPDAQPAELLIDGHVVASGIPHLGFAGPIVFPAGKFSLEVRMGGQTVWYKKKFKLKKGRTSTIIMTGTVNPGDKHPVSLSNIVSK